VLAALRSETALSRVEAANLQKVFALNAFGPILVSKVGNTLLHPRVLCSLHADVIRAHSMGRLVLLQAFSPLLINAAKANGASE